MKLLPVCFGAALAVALSPTVYADSLDHQFLATLAAAGVPSDGIPDVIQTAHDVCTALDGGTSAETAVDRLANFGYGLDPTIDVDRYRRSMARFVQAAVDVYCPYDQGRLGRGSVMTPSSAETAANP